MKIHPCPTLTIILGCLFFNTPLAHCAVFTSFDPNRHERYLSSGLPNPNFILPESQLTGIGGRAVLVSPQHVLAAVHFSGGSPYTARFRGSDGVVRSYLANSANRTDLNSITINDVNGDPIPGASDIRVFKLDTPVDLNFITPVPIAIGNPVDFIGREAFLIGQDPLWTGGNEGGLNTQAGKNIIDAVSGAAFGGSAPRASLVIEVDHDTPTNGGTGGLPDEVSLEGGDSGHQALIQIGSEIALVGMHFGIEPGMSPSAQPNYKSFSTFLSPYIDEIDGIVTRDGFSIRTIDVNAVAVAVPEPGLPLAALLATVMVTLRRQKSA